MARVCFVAILAGLLLQVRGMEIPEKKAETVFVSRQAADTVLRRQRRFNEDFFQEKFQKDNLEQECIEEVCSYEEAREVFENEEDTMKFWTSYIDGDQCQPPPCQNGGVCEDQMSDYICMCQPNFTGKNCEIEVKKQCLIDNGGCSHICEMEQQQRVCRCPAGYRFGANKISCEPTGSFSCGVVELTSSSSIRSIINPRSSSTTYYSNSSTNLEDNYSDDNITEIYDYYELALRDPDPDPSNTSAVHKRSPRSDSHAAMNGSEWSNVTETAADKKPPLSLAFYPTIPTITARDNMDQRIVGGDDALAGEIPWQVALMSYSESKQKTVHFCGGSLLNELWVITAAHCLYHNHKRISNTDFFVRVGELDLNVHEGPERNHSVESYHIHRSYHYKKSQYNHDIALLKLTNPVELSHHRRPICLGPSKFTEDILKQSSSSLVSGWGALRFHGLTATKLQKLSVPFVDRTICKKNSRDHVTRFMFCAGFPSGEKDSCQGDSGGPHATNYRGTWYLTGIVSWGEECARDEKYGVYTHVSKYYPWIQQTTQIAVTN